MSARSDRVIKSLSPKGTLKPLTKPHLNVTHIVLKSRKRTIKPSRMATSKPTFTPSAKATIQPTLQPTTCLPTSQPATLQPTLQPSHQQKNLKYFHNETFLPTTKITNKFTSNKDLIADKLKTSVVWLRPSHGLEMQTDTQPLRGQLSQQGAGKHCWESIGLLDEHSRMLMLSKLFGYHNQSDAHMYQLLTVSTDKSQQQQGMDSQSSMWLASQKLLDNSFLMPTFMNITFKNVRFCYSSSEANVVRGIHGKNISSEFSDKHQLAIKDASPEKSEFYALNDLTKPHLQITYPHNFATESFSKGLSSSRIFYMKPYDNIYYFLVSPSIQHSAADRVQCFFGSDRFGHFCLRLELFKDELGSGTVAAGGADETTAETSVTTKVRVHAGFKGTPYSTNDTSAVTALGTSATGFAAMVHDVSQPAEGNLTILIAYRCRYNKDKSNDKEGTYALSVSINGEAFESLATASLRSIPHPVTLNLTSNVTTVTSQKPNTRSSSRNVSNSLSVRHPLGDVSLLPAIEYQWLWSFDNGGLTNTHTATVTAGIRPSKVDEQRNGGIDPASWRFGCSRSDCQHPWNIAEILIIESAFEHGSTSASEQLEHGTGLTDAQIAGGFRHFRYKYHIGETLSHLKPRVDHNRPPGTVVDKTRIAVNQINRTRTGAFVGKQQKAPVGSSGGKITKQSFVTPVYSDCKPFDTHQIDQYTPPKDAAPADVKRWAAAVSKVMNEIRAFKQGGETFQKFMLGEASKLQDIRDQLFCHKTLRAI